MDLFTPEGSSNSGAKVAHEQKKGDECSTSPLTHLFVELTSLEELSFPTSSSTRIKFTCLDASAHYLAVGSTSGTVYLFSRFASKYRNCISSVPIQVIYIKDGPIIKLSISPNEKYLATANKRGSLTISALVGIGQNPVMLFSSESHVSTGELYEYGKPTHVTELRWCSDSSKIYAGDTKGRISRTLIHVGKRLRKGHFGAVFYSDQQKGKSRYGEECNCAKPISTNTCNELMVIFASRPNGRLWEANGRGVVYSTHQYRNLKALCRFPVVSFKSDNLFNSMTNINEVRDINFGLLTLIRCQNNLFLITKADKTFCLIDPLDSHMVLMSTVDCIDSIREYAVNDSDVFLLSETGSLRKLTLFTVEKAVEKLHWRQCYSQAAQLICVDYIMNENYNSVAVWNYEQLEDILNKITFHHYKSHVTDGMLNTLHKLLNELKRSDDAEGKPKAAVHRLSIHRVVQVMQNSGYEDDFTFRAPSPLRLRSKSTLHIKPTNDWKRRSLPLNQQTIMGKDIAKFEDPEERHRKLINEARIMLLNAEKAPTNQLVRSGSVESLRTLLDGCNSLILFDQQVTINDITRDLVAAKKFQQLIGHQRHDEQNQRQRTAQVDFKTLFGRRDPLEMLEKCVESIPLSVNVNVTRFRTVAPAIEYEKSELCEWNSEQQSTKRDFAANESLNLNCNETPEGDEGSKCCPIDQSLKDDIGLLNKSYVIEKNFVAVQPIEMTWTVNGDNEESDSVDTKSLEAAIALNSNDKCLIRSSKIAIPSEALALSEAKLDRESIFYCHICGLHRLWHYVMTFGPRMSQLRVTVDQFAAGGVPVAIEQWVKLFEYRTVAAISSESSSGKLCNTCATFFEFDDHLKQKASSLREMIERVEKRSMKKKCSKNLVQLEAKDWNEDLVYRMFFRDMTAVTKKLSGIQNKVGTNSHLEISREQLGLDECSKKFLWLPTVEISQLLLCMRYCEGLSTVFEFLKNNKKLTSYLTTVDWQWLAVMKAYECDRFLNLMPKEVINGLLSELKISTIKDVGTVSSALAFDLSGMVSSAKSLSGSLTISVDGNCACCTLPLKMRVTRDDGYISVFRCGHLYHQICLREANLSRCLRCELERKRHRQK
ncbi:unnamed protein product [Litomosoides sigmodontis]|uniref:RING-type domain-containing protein n=1 Tax=Litomosoides sigmodontis TaxID=42156 RepID=A0A3P6T6X4_LITSI|nr:unnamed protein product [Litomosoides sigmodontis]